MVLSSVQVLLEVVPPVGHDDPSIKRWISAALAPIDKDSSGIDVSGEAFITEPERLTRSRSRIGQGKICVCETTCYRSADEAVLFAGEVGAQALLITHEPENVLATIPIIVITQEQFQYIKGCSTATISVMHVSESYKGINVALEIQRLSPGPGPSPLRWNSKMYVPTSMLEKTKSSLDFAIVNEAAFYRDGRNDEIVFFVSGEQNSGKICLVDAIYPGDARRAIDLATEFGASAIFICCKETPDWSRGLTLPAIAIGKDELKEMQKAGLRSGDMGVSISYEDAKTSVKPPPSPQPGGRVGPPGNVPPQRSGQQATKEPSGSRGGWGARLGQGLGQALEQGLKAILGYSPKSKEEFDAIVRNEISWSYEDQPSTSFRRAMLILDRVRSLDSPEDQRAEIALLIKTIHEMTKKRDFVGDVQVILFCAHILSAHKNVSTSELKDAMVTMVNGLLIDPEVAKIEGGYQQILDQCIVRLTKHLSNLSSNRSSHSNFVLNALWIRRYHCDALGDGTWDDLNRVTSMKYIESQKDTILSFMDTADFNTLVITSFAHDLRIICRFVGEENHTVPILPAGLKRFQVVYERNKWTADMWQREYHELRELTVLNIIGRLAVKDRGEGAKRGFIGSVIKRASFGSVKSFENLHTLHSSLKVEHKNYRTIIHLMAESMYGSLVRRDEFSPTPSDISSLLQLEIGSLLVANRRGRSKLMSFAKANGNKEGIFELFGHIYDLIICHLEGTEAHETIDELVDAISVCISRLNMRDDFAVAAFQVASSWSTIFTCPEEETNSICPRLGKIIVTNTGIASSIRYSPTLLHAIPSIELTPSSDASLIGCLVREFIRELTDQCVKIEDAVSFCISARSLLPPLTFLENVASDIIINSFSNYWSPSSIGELLEEEGSTLVDTHKILSSLPEGDNSISVKDTDRRAEGEKCACMMRTIILKWLSNYDSENFNAHQLGEVYSVLTGNKRKSVMEISGRAFPTKKELEEQITAITDTCNAICLMLTIHSDYAGSPFRHSILDLASAYRIKTDDDSLFSKLVAKYLSGKGLAMSLADLRRDRDRADSFLQSSGRELKAASYFLTNTSVLFQHELGKWGYISIEDFLAKISAALDYFATLFSPSATYSIISKVAEVALEGRLCLESELRALSSFPHLAIDPCTSTPYLLHSIALAKASEPLQNFVDCCKAYKFMFVTSDEKFSEVSSICEKLFGEDGLGLEVAECYNMGLRIADILVPNSASLDLGQRLDLCLPILQFFDALRYCSSVFSLAKDRIWFGEEGLQTFYKEWTNVSNVFQGNQSFENEVLDRLEPTVRALSVVGGALDCCSIASLFAMLQGNADILRLDEMRLVQANILKVQDWFSEGMDDMSAILSKFVLIQTSGRFVIYSATEFPVLKRALALSYSRSQTSEGELATMTGDDIKDFVQYLGFVNQDGSDATNSASKFIDIHRHLSEIVKNQQALIDVGFNDNSSTATMEYALQSPESHSAVAKLLDESQEKLKQCRVWLKGVRSKYRYSLLFWMDELRHIFHCMSEVRSMSGRVTTPTMELVPIQNILDAMSRVSPEVSQNSACRSAILRHITESQPVGISWLEDVSSLVNKCGEFSARLHLPCFEAVKPTCHRRMIIHKINCCEDMLFAAPLHILRHIYKSRRPASFEVLDGACVQSPDEIELFLERVLAFPDQTFTIIGVDELPANEQEIVANFLAKYSRSADSMKLHCIQSRDTILHAPPGIEIRLWDDSSLNVEQLGVWLQNYVISERSINNITIVCGSHGSGKTRCIRREMEKLATNTSAEVASLYIHEDFSLSKAVASLRSKFTCGPPQHRAIHVGLSMAATPPKDLMLSVNSFFNSFLVLQSIYDPSSGNCFHPGTHLYALFVELDCVENENICRAWLERHVPALTCCNGIIQPPLEYTIDDQTRRVCTYLRAYDNGTIDRKFNPKSCNKRIMFVLDKSESMEIDLGGRNSLQVAADCMLNIFDSHVQQNDHVGLIRFNHEFEVLIPLQRLEDDHQRGHLRTTMHSARSNPRGSTHMYTALSQALNSLNHSSDADGLTELDAWIICLTDGMTWDSNEHLRSQLQNSPTNLHIILVGVNLDGVYGEAMAQLCNKYQTERNPRNKGFFLPTSANMQAIEDSFNQVASRIPVSQTFELDGIMSDAECRAKLEEHLPEFIDPKNKLQYSFWVNFLYRRVSVFDQNDDFNYNEEHESLGSSLMEVMLSESEKMLQRDQNCSWTSSNHTQLIYDFAEGDSPQFRLICTSPDDLGIDQRERLNQLDLPGFKIPTISELRERQTLDRYLSQALSIPLNEGPDGRKRLQCIDENKFVLTLDFTLKLLNVHERVSCGVPCLMEGETGVSKTALTKMYSILVNSQQTSVASASTVETLKSILHDLATAFPAVALGDDEINCGVTDQILKYLVPSPEHNANEASLVINELIHQACATRNAIFVPIPSNLSAITEVEDVSQLLTWFSEAHLEPTFFEVNIDPALTADDIKCKIDEVRLVAQKLLSLDVKVVVFFDEINTSSVLGLLKEMIVDRSLNGDHFEKNIVVIAACNPVRSSAVSQAKSCREIDLGRDWVSGHYQVKKLPTTLELMSWDFGSLNSEQEKEFIHQRIIMMDESIPKVLVRSMTEVISTSHELIRTLAQCHIAENLETKAQSSEIEMEAKLRARSAVSLRDIQRVFHLFNFFLHDFRIGLLSFCESPQKFRRAMLLSVGIVYYLRLDTLARREFVHKLSSLPSEQHQDCYLREVLESAINALVEQTEIPEGIALTSGLKENVFMTLVCTLSRTPLMIIGPPGCSKTLAVSIACDNANGEESPQRFYRKYARVQPFHYQCSKSSTSNEVAAVFDRAIQRQSKVDRSKQQCLVFMDEAGLPEEEKESLKVLHYLLEGHMSASPEVGFVCITNHILDAAKSNRCVCLLRPEPDKEELMCIAMGVLCQKHKGDASKIEFIRFEMQVMTQEEFASIMCESYLNLIQNKKQFGWFVEFFGLRDFLHALRFLRRNAFLNDAVLQISVEILLHALERNFNGVGNEKFSNICASFLANLITDKRRIEESLNEFLRHPMIVLQNSLSERHPEDASRYNLPRYKLIIDNTNDGSVMRLLRMAGIFNSSHSFYMLSGMEQGSEIEQLNLVSRIKYAAQQGASVVMSQVVEISECFYDLFNQHFKEFTKEGETSYFANIAIGGISRPCIIHPSFQCVVHVQSNQLDEVPAPFLNRFEKFQLNIDDILSWQLSRLPPGINQILSSVLLECEELLSHLGSTIWSPSPNETLKSLFIGMIPPDADLSNLTQSSGPVSARQPISSNVLAFLRRWLIINISNEDIEQSIATASSELCGFDGIEFRKVQREGCQDQSALEKSFHDLAIGVALMSPISRSLKEIVHYAILRHVTFRLLLVAMPEAVFLQRKHLPKDALRAYFGGSQEHFNLNSLISKMSMGNSQLCMVHVRSDSCAHNLPTWCAGEEHTARTHEKAIFRSAVENIVYSDSSNVEIRHLDLLKSESLVRNTMESWASKEEADYFIFVADMQLHGSSDLVNFIRAQIEKLTLAPTKKFLLLLHYPLSCKPSYPALFLGGWQCFYLDGIGYRGASSSHLSVNDVFAAACFNCDLNVESLLDALLPKAAQYVASQVLFYACSPHSQSINQNMHFTERLAKVEAVMKRQINGIPLGKLLMKKYINMWTKEAILDLLHRSAHGLKSGTTHLSLSTAVRNTFQHTFNKFLANAFLDMNAWSNLDMLDEACSDSETDGIFALVLGALPIIPLKELLLHRDVYRYLNPLPLDLGNSMALTFFPFYYHVTSFIDMALDRIYGGPLDSGPQLDQNGYFHNMMETVDEMFASLLENSSASALPIDEPMAAAIRGVIEAIESSYGLFERYISHMLRWKFGIQNLSRGIKWIADKMNDASLPKSACNQNIVALHIFCRLNLIDIIRMSSWDTGECVFSEGSTSDGSQVIGMVLRHFKTSLTKSADVAQWSRSFLLFTRHIGSEAQIDEKSTVVELRQLVFLSVTINVNAPDLAVSRVATYINEATHQTIHSLCDFFQLLQNITGSGASSSWTKDAKEKLLRIFFSPSWLRSVSDIDQADAKFLIALIKEESIGHQMAVVHLRSLLISNTNTNDHNATQFILPTKLFSQSIAQLTCRSLPSQGVSDFCKESKKRRGMRHYIPSWLCSVSQATTNDEPEDDISWFLRDYRNTIDCSLAGAVFDVLLGVLMDRISKSGSTSEQLLLLLEQILYHERNVSQIDHVRRARQALQPDPQATVSFVGSSLGALEADALIICLVSKIAEELSTASQASALSSIDSHSAMRVLNVTMAAPKWPDFFFSVILRLRGEGHLASLLGEGGALNSFDWCAPWKQGISLLRQNIVSDLTEAENNLRNAQRDIMQYQQQYRACPHCRGLFGVDQRNCGQFTCGRDAHGVEGAPAVGGQAVRETYGCGRVFSIDQSLPYTQSNQHTEDQARLQQLNVDYERKRNAFDEFTRGNELRRRAAQLDIPPMSFHVQREQVDGAFPSIHFVDFMPEEEGHPGTRLLVSILRHLPKLEHLSYLPAMIELYVFVHKTFRHMVTKEQAMNMKVENVMDEHLLRNRFGSIDCAHLQRLWSNVVKGVNAFLSANESVVNWDCEEVTVPFRDISNCSLISILSEMEHPTEGHDYLFLIINELVLRYNDFVKSISEISGSNDGDHKVEEIHPRTLLHGSRGGIILNGAISNTQGIIDNLVESYWIKDERTFNTESLTNAISFDMGMIGQLQSIKSPLSFLRERFAFRECNLNAVIGEGTSDACFCSTDGLFFVRNEDLSLYEEVKESWKTFGFVQGTADSRHSMIVTFQNFSHDSWTSLLEGLRNSLGHLQQSNFLLGEAQFGQTVTNMCGAPTLQGVGFPAMDNAQSNFLNSLTKSDVLEVIKICGEQLSSEAYQFVGISNRLAEPLPQDTADSMREGIMRLLKSKSTHDVITEINAFCDDVLDFYCERLIVPASETTNDGLTDFLKRNNCCDESDAIFAAIPASVAIRNYIAVRKVLQQAKLKLLFDSRERVPSTNAEVTYENPGDYKLKYSKWRWSVKPESQDDVARITDERYCWKAFGNLWFEDALSKGNIDPEEVNVESEDANVSVGTEEKKDDTNNGPDSVCVPDTDCVDGNDGVPATLPESAMPSTESGLAEHGVQTTKIEDVSTEQQVNVPISIKETPEEDSKGKGLKGSFSIGPFALGTALVLLGIILGVALVSFTNPTASKPILDKVETEAGDVGEMVGRFCSNEEDGSNIGELGSKEGKMVDVGTNDEACNQGAEVKF